VRELNRRALLKGSTALAITASVPGRPDPALGLSVIENARGTLGLDQHWRFGFMTAAEVRAREQLPPL
jgi:hypothetical protein